MDCVFTGVYDLDNPNFVSDSFGCMSLWAIVSYSIGLNGDVFLFLAERDIYLREV